MPDNADKERTHLAAFSVHQRFSVEFDYPVCFTRGLFDAANPLLAETMDRLKEGRRHRAAVYVDAGLATAMPQLAGQICEYFHEHPATMELAAPPRVLSGGEAAKHNWQSVREVMSTLGNLHLDRQSFVIAVGGGALLDMVGFAASIVHRGLRLVRAPTTTLAQNDAGVGVKTGMDEHGMKNFVGTFAPPFAVLNDSSFLAHLPLERWIEGAAEAFKVALIRDAQFLDWLCVHAGDLAGRDETVMAELIRRCAILHLRHIADSGDAFEMGSARPLDFAHWSAHKLETLSGYQLGHGQAVAIGICLDLYYAMRKGLVGPDDFERVASAVKACGLPVWSEHLAARNRQGQLLILAGLEEFREHLGGVLTVTLPDGVGKKLEVHQVDPAVIEEGVEVLRSKQ